MSTSVQKFLAKNKMVTVFHEPAGTTAENVDNWQSMKNFQAVLVSYMRCILTGTLTSFSIVVDNTFDGSGTPTVVVSKTISSNPNAVGDQIYLETNAQEVLKAALGANLTGELWVTAQVEEATATSDSAVGVILSEPNFIENDLTADIVV